MAIAKPIGVNEIRICNTSNIDSMRHGRPQTVLVEQGAALPNGAIVTLTTTTKESGNPADDHVYGIDTAAVDLTKATGKFIIVDPEINVEQYRRIDNSLAKFGLSGLEEEATHTAYELQLRDRIEYSQAYFADQTPFGAGTPELVYAAMSTLKFGMNENGQLVTGDALRVVSVREQRIPLMMAGVDAQGNPIALPQSYLMVKLEVIA